MTKSDDSGAIAPQFLIILFFVSALALGAGIFLSTVLTIERRSIAFDEERNEFYRIVTAVITDIRADQTPEVDGPDDPVWAWNDRSENGYTVKIRSLSSSLNPNFVRKNILEGTALLRLFKAGRTPDELQQFREDKGLFLSDTGYQDFFEKDIYQKYFSGYGWANVNLVDEFAVRSLATAITGSEMTGASVREKVRNLLSDGKVVNSNSLRSFLGGDYDSLFPFINAEPIMNVNFIDPVILKEIVSYPEYKVASPEIKAEELLAFRTKGGASEKDILNILGIDKDSRLFYFFGCITWFWEIRIQGKNETCVVVICRYPSEDTGLAKNAIFRTIEMRFEE